MFRYRPRRWRRATGSLAARGAAEFWGLDEIEARRRLATGIGMLRDLGLAARGFTPPGYLAGGPAIAAAKQEGVRYVAEHLWIRDLDRGSRRFAPAFSHRPFGTGQKAAERFVRRGPPAFARRGVPVRIALHPDDLKVPALRAATLESIDRALESGARPTTYLDFLGGR